TMRGMNTFMPIMSAILCFSFPVGIGIYWIVGAVIRCVQQIVINNYMNKIDMEDLVRHNQEKVKKKLEKKGVDPQKINQQARMNVRNIQEPQTKTGSSVADKAANVKKSTDYYKNANTSYKPGSLAAKANMVRQFDEKNGKKK
ncbi:MAG TPA: YidC/Oxa1 family membrane protein insertase, partial [Candidatus Pullilachnospira stercoravium]|nr:YidC/Oxa1 family membrane protein insertase [Candidatus Pullilachnospira stercoravium]